MTIKRFEKNTISTAIFLILFKSGIVFRWNGDSWSEKKNGQDIISEPFVSLFGRMVPLCDTETVTLYKKFINLYKKQLT